MAGDRPTSGNARTGPVLRAVSEAVRAEGGARVARVIAYGSRVGGNPRPDSDLDLLIVVFGEPDRDLAAGLRHAAQEASPWPVTAFVVSERRFEETKEIPGGMTFAPHRRGVVLYRHPDSPRSYADLRPREDVRRDLTRFWVRRGGVFLEVARTMLDWGEGSYVGAAGYARRSAEWYLRGYFTAHGIDTGKVHGFRDMREHVAGRDPELAEDLAVADPLGRHPLPLGATERVEVTVSEADARDALRRAARVAEILEERLGEFPAGDDG